MFFPRCSLKLKPARLCKKTTFQALKKSVFPHGSFETQRSSALQKKTIFQAPNNCFLRTNLLKFIQAWLCKKKSGSKKLCFLRTALMKLEKKNNFSDSKKNAH